MSSDEQWEALEITGEDSKRYKIKWAGIDPDTREPWEDSWTLKKDVTSGLVNAWNYKKALVAQQKRKTQTSTSSSTSKSVVARKSRVARSKHSEDSSESIRQWESDYEEVPKKPAKNSAQRKPTAKGKAKERARPAKATNPESESDDETVESHSRTRTRSTRSRGSERIQSTIEADEPVIKIGPPKRKKRKANNTSEGSPQKKRRLPSYTTDDDSGRFRAPSAPRRDASEGSHFGSSVNDVSTRPYQLKQRVPVQFFVAPYIPRTPSHSPSPRPPACSPEVLHNEPLEDPSENPSGDVLEDGPPPPPPRAPSLAEEDEEDAEKSLLHEMEKSYLNLDPRQSPTSPVRLPLRESQQEVIDETIYLVEQSSYPVTTTTQEVNVGTQSQLLLTSQLSPSQPRRQNHQEYNQLSADYARLQAEHTALEATLDSLEETLSFMNDRVSQLDKLVDKLRHQRHTELHTIFDAKIQALETELKKANQLILVLEAKDRLTNDEVRYRAACEPELRARNKELKTAVKQTAKTGIDLQLTIEDLLNKIETLEVSVKMLEDRNKRCKDALTISQERVREVEEDAGGDKETIRRLQEATRESESKIAKLEETVANSEERLQELEEEAMGSKETIRRLEEATKDSSIEFVKLEQALKESERLREKLLSKEQAYSSVSAVQDEDIELERKYAVCEFVLDGKRCLKRFHTGEAVVQHALQSITPNLKTFDFHILVPCTAYHLSPALIVYVAIDTSWIYLE
ncbi:hypothetical protein QCA50_006940 [Cerrena zonata]|uniref:Chromo domain-containing protein n=1 Tax=Cerrena zonata TaxID=2478898 RepID=A0AAW0GA89_9APHY